MLEEFLELQSHIKLRATHVGALLHTKRHHSVVGQKAPLARCSVAQIDISSGMVFIAVAVSADGGTIAVPVPFDLFNGWATLELVFGLTRRMKVCR